MVDHKKVIKGLECCKPAWFTITNCADDYCPYNCYGHSAVTGCVDHLIDDALELLKEQEPVAHATWLCEETSTAYDLYGVKTWAAKYKCSKCGSVHRAIEAHMCYSYCPMCGARMDEDAKEGET